MKWLFSLLLLVSATTLQAQERQRRGEPPVPLQPVAVATLSAATKMINFRLSWNQTEVVDSTMVAIFLSRDSVPVLYRRTKPIDTVSFSIPDDTTTYRFLLVSVRRGLASLPANVNYFFNADQYYKLTGIQVVPKNPTVLPGAKIQFCALLEFNDGSIILRDKDKVIPACVTEYNKIDVALRKPIGARLRNANKTCVRWEVTGGTIEPEVCTP
jgi:hypothetical protein